MKAAREFFLVAPFFRWSRMSLRLHHGRKSLELTEFGRAVSALFAKVAAVFFGFWSQKSGNAKFWLRRSRHALFRSQKSGHAKNLSLKSGREFLTSTSENFKNLSSKQFLIFYPLLIFFDEKTPKKSFKN